MPRWTGSEDPLYRCTTGEKAHAYRKSEEIDHGCPVCWHEEHERRRQVSEDAEAAGHPVPHGRPDPT